MDLFPLQKAEMRLPGPLIGEGENLIVLVNSLKVNGLRVE